MKKVISAGLAIVGTVAVFGIIGGVECNTIGLLPAVPMLAASTVMCWVGLASMGAFCD